MPYRSIHARNTPAAAQIVSCAPKRPETPPGRIVDHRQQATLRAAPLKPRMKTAIELHQLAEVRFPLAAAPMRTPLPRATPQARRQHPAPQRVVMHVHAVLAGQVLRRQRRPESLVDRAAVFLAHQRQDALALRRVPGRIGPAAGAAMFQASRALGPVAAIQAASPGDSSPPSPPPPTPSSTSPPPPAPTRPPASALVYSSPSAPICDLPVASLGGHFYFAKQGTLSLRFNSLTFL